MGKLCACIVFVSFRIYFALVVPKCIPPLSSMLLNSPEYKQKLVSIVERVLQDNQNDLRSFVKEEELIRGLLRDVVADGKILFNFPPALELDDQNRWNQELSLVSDTNNSWHSAPTSVSERSLYRIISRYLRYRDTFFDPFILEKFRRLEEALYFTEQLAARLPDLLESPREAIVEFSIQISLWNQKLGKELGCYPQTESSSWDSSRMRKKRKRVFSAPEVCSSRLPYLLDNQLLKVVEQLLYSVESSKRKHIDIIVGPVGAELVADLFLAHILLHLKICSKIVLHTKSYPSVMEATNRDVFAAVQLLSNPSTTDKWHVRAFGDALRNHLRCEEIELLEDSYWCGASPFWELPSHIESVLADSAMVIVKGDLNYRRLLGDRDWPLDLSANSVLGYWGAIPVCALRILQSPIGCGIDSLAIKRAETFDRNWQISGDWAVIQSVW